MFRRLPRQFPPCLAKASGFTLIELMIVVAIIGVLAAIAYPSYMDSIQKGKRTGAKVAIMEVAQAQERYFSINMKYADALDTLRAGGDAGLGEAEDYTVTVAGLKSDSTTCTAGDTCVTYTITAIPKATSTQNHDASCQQFSLTHTGIQAAEDGGNVDTSAICW